MVSKNETHNLYTQMKGSRLECYYELMSYGIPVTSFPIKLDGSISDELLLKFVEDRKILEEQERLKYEDMIMPTPDDVLLGRGRPYQDFPGNVRLSEIVNSYRLDYLSAKKSEKPFYTQKVLTIIRNSNGRFLKKSDAIDNHWVPVDDDMARDKISHTFRSKPRKPPASTGLLSGLFRQDDTGSTSSAGSN